jgi:hypothetical protein
MKTLVLSNYDPLEDAIMFTSDRGSWNVSRAQRDCDAGKHKLYKLDVRECYRANAPVEIDERKVEAFMRMPDVITLPGIAVMEDGAAWFIEGHHRLRGLFRLGIADFACYVIEEADAAPYIVRYNGERKPPFKI